MHEDDILDDIKKNFREEDLERAPDKEPVLSGPIKILITLIIVLIFVLWVVPHQAIKTDPEPKPPVPIAIKSNYIPPRLIEISQVNHLEVTQTLRTAVLEITSQSCKNSEICYAKSLFYYTRDIINYIKDPKRQYVQSPEETLLGAGDCEDKAILLYMMMKAIDIESRIVIIPGHAYLQVKMPKVLPKYKDKEGWVNLDPTCQSCGFGELPPGNADKDKRYIY